MAAVALDPSDRLAEYIHQFERQYGPVPVTPSEKGPQAVTPRQTHSNDSHHSRDGALPASLSQDLSAGGSDELSTAMEAALKEYRSGLALSAVLRPLSPSASVGASSTPKKASFDCQSHCSDATKAWRWGARVLQGAQAPRRSLAWEISSSESPREQVNARPPNEERSPTPRKIFPAGPMSNACREEGVPHAPRAAGPLPSTRCVGDVTNTRRMSLDAHTAGPVPPSLVGTHSNVRRASWDLQAGSKLSTPGISLRRERSIDLATIRVGTRGVGCDEASAQWRAQHGHFGIGHGPGAAISREPEPKERLARAPRPRSPPGFRALRRETLGTRLAPQTAGDFHVMVLPVGCHHCQHFFNQCSAPHSQPFPSRHATILK